MNEQAKFKLVQEEGSSKVYTFEFVLLLCVNWFYASPLAIINCDVVRKSDMQACSVIRSSMQ